MIRQMKCNGQAGQAAADDRNVEALHDFPACGKRGSVPQRLPQFVRRAAIRHSELMQERSVCVCESQRVSRTGLGGYTWRLLRRIAIDNHNIRET
jgi:hypothetical protein